MAQQDINDVSLAFSICENEDADQLCSNCTADQCLCFATQIVQFLFFSNPKHQASSLLLRLYRLICVGPGRTPNYRQSSTEQRDINDGSAGFKCSTKEKMDLMKMENSKCYCLRQECNKIFTKKAAYNISPFII